MIDTRSVGEHLHVVLVGSLPSHFLGMLSESF